MKTKKRRQHGSGGIVQLDSDGRRWKVKAYLNRSDCSRVQRSKNVRGTKTEALAVLEKMRAADVVDDDALTFGALVERFLEAKARSREETTYALYRRTLYLHAIPRIGLVRVRDLRAGHIEKVLRSAQNSSRTAKGGQPLGRKTLANLHTYLKLVLRRAVRQGIVLRNVAEQVEPISVDHIERPEVTLESAGALLSAFRGRELEPFVTFALATGARRGEICALRWSDVDLSQGTFTIRRAAKNVGRTVLIGKPKTASSQRSGFIGASALAALARHRVEQAERHLRLGLGNRGVDGFVFDRWDGRMWDPNAASRQFGRRIRSAKLPPLRLHDLRHGFAINAFAAGGSLKAVSDALGHSSVAITSKVYVRMLNESRKDLADRLDARMGTAFREASSH